MELVTFLAGLSVVISLISLWTVSETVKQVTANTEVLVKKGADETRRDLSKIKVEQTETRRNLSRLDKEYQVSSEGFTRSLKRHDDELSEVRAWYKDYEDTQNIRKRA